MLLKNITSIIGQSAEKYTLNYLKNKGLKLIAKNYRSRNAEIDLIMQDREYIVFIEVRFREKNIYGKAFASVNYRKQKKIIEGAKFFLLQNPEKQHMPCRFDVVGIEKNNKNIDWIKNAFITK